MRHIIRHPCTAEYEALLDIWLRSVRATHSFLSEADIHFFHPMVRELFDSDLELWAVFHGETNLPLGFMALDNEVRPVKIEALFIDPDCMRQGVGFLLVRHAQCLKGSLVLDVNEQNPGARAFYQRIGFIVTGRSPFDRAGKPFPLIHMLWRPTNPERPVHPHPRATKRNA